MSFILNLIWFLFFGWANALGWLLVSFLFYLTIVGAPIGRACLEFAKLSAFPFGKVVVSEKSVIGKNAFTGVKGVIYLILNLIWLPFGLLFTFLYLVQAVLLFCTIIGIPVALVYMKMGQFVLFPVGTRVVNKEELS